MLQLRMSWPGRSTTFASVPYLVEPVIPAGSMSSVEQPELPIDNELSLRPFAVGDAAFVMQAYSEPDIQRWHGLRIDSIEEAEDWIVKANERWRDERSAIWAIAGESGKALGRCALHIDARAGTAEIAYWVVAAARGRRVAPRAARAVTAWGHQSLGIQRILLQHTTANVASCAVAQRAGYAEEGTARQQGLHIDGWHDMHQHSHLITDPM